MRLMASVREVPRKDKTTAYTVVFRHSGKQRALAFDTRKSADALASLINAHGPDKALEMHGIELRDRATAEVKPLTVSEWIRHHIDHLTGVEQYTIDKYNAYLKNDIGPAFGDKPLTALTEEDIAVWVKSMETTGGRGGTGHSPKTLRNKYGFLSGALNAAVPKHIPANPAAGRKLPRGKADDDHDMRMLSRDEFAALHDAVPQRWKLMVEFMVASGMRWGEVSALQPKHVNLKAGTVQVRQAWKYSTAGYTLGPPKTKRSRRTVDVPTRLLKKLDLSGEYVFTNTDGGPVRYQRFWRDVWNPAVAQAELDPKPTPHDLRHTYASWQLTGGTPITIVSRQLGHESIQVTVDLYTDVDRTSSRQAADFMDKMLS